MQQIGKPANMLKEFKKLLRRHKCLGSFKRNVKADKDFPHFTIEDILFIHGGSAVYHAFFWDLDRKKPDGFWANISLEWKHIHEKLW